MSLCHPQLPTIGLVVNHSKGQFNEAIIYLVLLLLVLLLLVVVVVVMVKVVVD